jgi:hypothetical protein
MVSFFYSYYDTHQSAKQQQQIIRSFAFTLQDLRRNLPLVLKNNLFTTIELLDISV